MATIYLNDIEWQRGLAQVPTALREKRVAEIEQHAESLGVTCLAASPGELRVSLAGLRSPAAFFEYLEFVHAAAVDLEPGDIVPLMGRRSLDSLLVKKAVESGEAVFYKLEPSQIMETLRGKGFDLATKADAAPVGLEEAQAIDDLVDGGLLPERARREYIARAQGQGGNRDEFGAFNYSGNNAGRGAALPSEFEPDAPVEHDPFS